MIVCPRFWLPASPNVWGNPRCCYPGERQPCLKQSLPRIGLLASTISWSVTGGVREQVEALVGNSARTVFNPNYAEGEMLSSVQAGLAGLQPEVEAVLIGLGDQPQVQERSVRLVVDEYRKSGASIVVPSFQMRRGHPWLVARAHWDEILRMRSPESLRDFLNRHADEIHYVEVKNNSILQDLDTPEDYLKSKP